ncbi:MAG: hypothetical protein P4L65_04835 [Legionella sp.]|nr:hypothetical protein [Legionella sp.]
MYLIVDADCAAVPENVKPLASEGLALLNLLSCLNYDVANPPLADLLRQSHQLEGDWLILSPIHWQASHNDAVIVAAGNELQVQESDARLCFDSLVDYLAIDGMTLHYHDAETWLLCDKKNHPLNAKPVYQLLNKSLMPELSQLGSSLFWQKLVTESQMLFASRASQSVINGVWPWGAASLSDKKTVKICADEFFFPIAELCSMQVILYSPSVRLKEQQILLVSDLSVLSALHQEELKKIEVHWYWNNIAYTSGSNNWFTRLWRTFIHAN